MIRMNPVKDLHKCIWESQSPLHITHCSIQSFGQDKSIVHFFELSEFTRHRTQIHQVAVVQHSRKGISPVWEKIPSPNLRWQKNFIEVPQEKPRKTSSTPKLDHMLPQHFSLDRDWRSIHCTAYPREVCFPNLKGHHLLLRVHNSEIDTGAFVS